MDDLDAWLQVAGDERRRWIAEGVPMEERRYQLLMAINRLYAERRA